MKKKVGIKIAALVAGVCCVGGAYALHTEVASATALPSITLEHSGDTFLLTEQAYTAEESFVYTTTACFEGGQAAALVFGASETEENREYWVFNIDRVENSVKLLYFYENENDNLVAVELLRDWYIGNDKMTDGERSLVNPKVAQIDKVQLKVVVSVEEDGVYGEFYADNIRRFGVDSEYDLNELSHLPENVQYEGGFIGYNCFNAKVRFEETHYAESDYTYYTEAYRQQYHYSQYAHWNNDPNGLVYYNGYYHLYYQHHPFSNYWSDMYWGHARSKDLAHWELLPICLFPDTEGEWGPGNGYMWSGSAMVYRPGMSAEIDNRGWFPNGNGEGLIAFYTRDGGLQDQVLMSSDDNGMTWTKRVRIPQTIVVGPGKTDCRDPKVFPVKKEGDRVTLWGMAVTGMATGDIWFMKSTNLIDWTAAGGFKGFTVDVNRDFRSECPDVVFLNADDNTSHAVLTLTGRNYLVGDIAYDEANGKIQFIDLNGKDISTLPLGEIPYQKMDFGPDSYATQTFYIDDSSSEYYGKTVGVSWFSGVPGGAASIESGSLAANRKTWNGGGVTIPTIWGLVKTGNGYKLSQTPIVRDSDAFEKTSIVAISEDTSVNANGENLLKNVASRTVEISANIDNPNEESVYFRVQSSGNEYTEIGWTKADGYYVDRTHTYNGGLSMPNYHVRYTSGATDGKHLQFYILADNGSVEVFCDNYTIPFYVLTFAAPYSVGASFHTTGLVTVEELKVNQIASVWRDESVQTDETVLYVSQEEVELSKKLTNEKEVTVYATTNKEISWTVESGEDIVSVTQTSRGAIIKALNVGTASIVVTCGNAQKTISVTVYDGDMQSDVAFDNEGVLSGDWFMTSNGIIGSQVSGDGFLLSKTMGTDFTYSAKFNLGDGAAAALIFRANPAMTDYYIANYDKNGRIVKLWTPYGELANVYAGEVDVSNITLTVTAKGHRIMVALNGNTLVDVTDTRADAPLEGLFGLNVCATRAVFSAVGLQQDGYTYNAGDLVIKSAVEQGIVSIFNDTLGTVEISREFYSVQGREITLFEKYFATLAKTGVYQLTVKGKSTTFSVIIDVTALPKISLQNVTLQEGTNAVFFIGNESVTSVKVGGKEIDAKLYQIKDGMLTIDSSVFALGENAVELTQTLKAIVTVESLDTVKSNDKEKPEESGCNSSMSACALLPLSVIACALIGRKKHGNND